jgi:hypothetical protein
MAKAKVWARRHDESRVSSWSLCFVTWGVLASSALALPAASATATGINPQDLLDRPSDLAVYSIELRAEAGSEVVLPALNLDYLSDGTRTIRGLVLNSAGETVPGFFFEVDPILATYRTVKLPQGYLSRSQATGTPPLRRAFIPPTILHDPEECPA